MGEERIEPEDFLVGSVHQDSAVWKLIQTQDQLPDEWGLFWVQTFCPICLTDSMSILQQIPSEERPEYLLITELPKADILSMPNPAVTAVPAND